MIAIHSQFDLSEAKQTARVLRALERPAISILAHPFGRLFGTRPALALDFERVLTAVKERGCFLEINSQPLAELRALLCGAQLTPGVVRTRQRRPHFLEFYRRSTSHKLQPFDTSEKLHAQCTHQLPHGGRPV